jgi:hypothetical protein
MEAEIARENEAKAKENEVKAKENEAKAKENEVKERAEKEKALEKAALAKDTISLLVRNLHKIGFPAEEISKHAGVSVLDVEAILNGLQHDE